MSAAGAPASAGGQEAQSLGRSRGGFATKLHSKTTPLGWPLEVTLTTDQRAGLVGVDRAGLEPREAREGPGIRVVVLEYGGRSWG